MPPKPKLVIFDWDNTLVNSWPIIHKAMNMTLRAWNRPEWSMEDVQNRVRHSMRDAFPALFGDDWKEAGEAYRDAFRSMHLDMLEALPDAVLLLNQLRDKAITTAIVSNKTGDILRKEIAHLGWQDYFVAAIGSGDLAADKPSPVSVEHLREKLALEASSTIWFVGDSIVDVDCARASGCMPVFYGEKFTYDGGKVVLNEGEWHAPNHGALIGWLSHP